MRALDVHRSFGLEVRVVAIRTILSLEDVVVFLSNYSAPHGSERPSALVGVERGTVNSSYEVQWGLGSRRLFLRLYEEQDLEGARAEADRLAYLAGKGVPTPAPLPLHEGGFIGMLGGKPAALFPWRPGDMRCLGSVTPEDARRVGEALARLHTAGKDAPRGPGRFEPEDLYRRLDRIAEAKDPFLASLAGPLRGRLASWADRRDPALPRGLIHGDLFRDNVLWRDDGQISALLDFESASDGPLAYDLMVTLLAWSFKDELDLEIARSIAQGYTSGRPLSEVERQGLLAEGAIAALRFTITRITDEAIRALESGRPPRRDKDWRRFHRRLESLEALGKDGLLRVLFP
jgi:homoserine kinase type II